jgi:hypothetical protein
MVWIVVAIAVVVVLLLAVAGVLLARQRRSRKLEEEFGPEYERTVEAHGDQRAGEEELLERQQRHKQFEIRTLEPTVREAYRARWLTTQRRFVDEPVAAVAEAELLVARVMHDRGYPVAEDFEQRAADISVDHPVVVQNYRAAQAISEKAKSGQANTEELRQSLVHFRALFADLLADDDRSSEDGGAPHARGAQTETRDTTTAR